MKCTYHIIIGNAAHHNLKSRSVTQTKNLGEDNNSKSILISTLNVAFSIYLASHSWTFIRGDYEVRSSLTTFVIYSIFIICSKINKYISKGIIQETRPKRRSLSTYSLLQRGCPCLSPLCKLLSGWCAPLRLWIVKTSIFITFHSIISIIHCVCIVIVRCSH